MKQTRTKRKIKTTKATITEYNNKTRKGTYIKITLPNQKRPKIYKYDEKVKVKDYIRKAEGNKRRTKQKATRNKIETIIKKSPIIENLIRKGKHETIIRQALISTPAERQTAKEKMITKMLYDKQLLKIMTEPENLKKLANRTEHIIEITGEKGETLITYNQLGKTTDEVINEAKEIIKTKEQLTKGKEYENNTIKALQIRNIKHQVHTSGTITEANIKIIIRKG